MNAKWRKVFEAIDSRDVAPAERALQLRSAWSDTQTTGRFDIIDKPLPVDKRGTVLAVIVSIHAGPIRIAMTKNEVVNLIDVLGATI